MGAADELRPHLEQLGKDHPAMRERDYNGRTLLLTACREGHVATAALLLEYGCVANTPNNDGWTPLHFACRGAPAKYGDDKLRQAHPPHWAELVLVLLDAKANPDLASSKGFTALHYACASGHFEAVRVLLQRGASCCKATKQGACAFHFACYLGHLNLVELLVKHEPMLVRETDAHGHTGLHFAACRGLHVQRTSRQIHSLFKGLPPLHEDLQLLKQNRLTESHCRHVDGHYPRIVRALLAAGADRYARSKACGANPLHVALWLGLEDEAHELLTAPDGSSNDGGRSSTKAGGLPRSKMEAGKRELLTAGGHCMGPYHLAAAQTDSALLKLLLAQKVATTNLPDALGRTPLHIAVMLNNLDNVAIFLSKGATADSSDADGRTPLLLAAGQPRVDIIQLVAQGYGKASRWVGVVDKANRSPLHYACSMDAKVDSLEMVSWLLAQGVAPSGRDEDGRTPLHFSCLDNSPHCEDEVKLLLRARAEVDVKDKDGSTPLHLCARLGEEKAAVQLIEHGASIDMPDGRGQTPIHLAARHDQEKLVQLLVQHSVRMTRDSLGLSPRDYAMRPRMHDLLKVEELRQGFELRFDACLTFILPRGSQEERDFLAAGHTLGPPDPDLVSAEHVSDLIYTSSVKKKRMEGAVTRLQRTVRGRQWRALMHLLKVRNRGPCRKLWDLFVAILVLPFQLIMWLLRFTRRVIKLLCRISFDCCCAPLLRRQRHVSSRMTTNRNSEKLGGGGGAHVGEMQHPNAKILAVLESLRMARVDYVLARLPGDSNDPRVFICLTMSLARLQQYAESCHFPCRLLKFGSNLDERLHGNTHRIPIEAFHIDKRDSFMLFRSKERLELLTHLLESKESFAMRGKDKEDKAGEKEAHEGRRRRREQTQKEREKDPVLEKRATAAEIHGAGLDVRSLIFHGVLSGFFRLHHPLERIATYNAWCQGVLPPVWPPHLFHRFCSEAAGVSAPGSHQWVGYFGERKALIIQHTCFYTSWLLFQGLAGVVTMLLQQAIDVSFDGSHDAAARLQRAVQVAYAAFTLLWCFGLRKAWQRQEAVLAYRWIAHYREADEKPLPQFNGRLHTNPVTGEQELWSSPLERQLKILAGGGITLLVLVVVVAIQLIPEVAQDEVTRRSGLSATTYQIISSLYTGVMVEAMGGWYKGLAMHLTEWENHRTPLASKESLNMKVFCFMVCNCYFSVVYIAFFDEDAHERAPSEHLRILSAQVSGLVCMRAVSHIIATILLPRLSSERRLAETDRLFRAHTASRGEARIVNGASDYGIASVFNNAHLTPPEELDDTMSHFALQYGFIAGFAVSTPSVGLLALGINIVLIRATVFKLLYVRQRDEPLRASGLPMWNRLFGMLTVLGIFSQGALIMRLFDLEGRHRSRLELSRSGQTLVSSPPPPSPPLPAPPPSDLVHMLSSHLMPHLDDFHTDFSDDTKLLLTILALLAFRVAVDFLPSTPAWLDLVRRREEYFSHKPFTVHAERRLTAATLQEQHDVHRSTLVKARRNLHRALCFLPVTVWRACGGRGAGADIADPDGSDEALASASSTLPQPNEHLDGILDISHVAWDSRQGRSADPEKHLTHAEEQEWWLWGVLRRLMMFGGAIATLIGAEAAPELL